jgi:hypothetical protein
LGVNHGFSHVMALLPQLCLIHAHCV